MPTIEKVREKLAPPAVPVPPPALLEAIKREIPETLPARPAAPRSRVPMLAWGSLAASVVVVVGAVALLDGGIDREVVVRQRTARHFEAARELVPAPTVTPTAAPTFAATPAASPAATPAPADMERLRSLGYIDTSDPNYIVNRDGTFVNSPEGVTTTGSTEYGKASEQSERWVRDQSVESYARLGDETNSGTTVTSESTAQPRDMYFREHGVNRATEPRFDPQSTFALDVDTGSFTLVRRYLDDGNLPPAAAVRVEEIVNALDYGDSPPEREDFSVRIEGAPTPFVPGIRHRLVRVGIRARQVEGLERKPAVLTFLLDTSGSMDMENRIGLVKRALGMLLSELRPEDRLALVTFGSRGQVLLRPTHDHDLIRRVVNGLRADGSTNLEEGLALAYQVAGNAYRPGAINRIVLLSDGVANVGLTEPESILGQVATSARRGIELTTVGVGMGNYNDALMERLADKGDGRYAYVDSVDEAHRLFVRELTSTLETIAADARVQVEWNPRAVSSYRLLGYENRAMPDQRFRDDTADAGEIGAGHAVTALYEVKLSPDAAYEPLATVRLRYRKPQGGGVVELAAPIEPHAVSDSWHDASRSLRLAAVAAELAETLRQAPPGRPHDPADLADAARRLATDFPGDRSVEEIRAMVERAVRLAHRR